METEFCIFCAAIGEAMRPLALSKSLRDDSAEEDSKCWLGLGVVETNL